ncbi:MBL fold metallo-hydrolase [Coprobacter secundus]|uniref:MBL fold metallo-hydrolase n=1 Tax=Coprobacter secundus TaxID=1501392 RepID=UPI0022E0E81A|nr:MBL fold metallo-hydrolase [Coprobacter secundus]
MSLRFMSLASGSSGNCYYLGNNEYGLLIDAGIGIRTIKKTLKENSIAFEKIIGLLITHDHADHIKSAGCLGEKYGIPVYTTSDILAGMNRSYCMSEKIYSAGRIIHKEVEFALRDFVITAFEVPHDGSDNVGYFVRYGNHNFAFATDLGHITERVARYLCQANYLVIEANYDEEMLQQGSYPYYLKKRIFNDHGHMSNAATAEFLANNINEHLRYIFLCHLSRENNHPELAYKTVEYSLYQQGIRVGKDVQLIALKRNHASEYYEFE